MSARRYLPTCTDVDVCDVTSCRFHLPTGRYDGCALVAADLGGLTLREVGEAMGFTRERARQVEAHALDALVRGLRRRGVEVSDGWRASLAARVDVADDEAGEEYVHETDAAPGRAA